MNKAGESRNRDVYWENCHPCQWVCRVCGTPILYDGDVHDPVLRGVSVECCGVAAIPTSWAEAATPDGGRE